LTSFHKIFTFGEVVSHIALKLQFKEVLNFWLFMDVIFGKKIYIYNLKAAMLPVLITKSTIKQDKEP